MGKAHGLAALCFDLGAAANLERMAFILWFLYAVLSERSHGEAGETLVLWCAASLPHFSCALP